MAEPEEYEAASQALLQQIEHPSADETGLSWLGPQIRQQLHLAEDEARLEWATGHPQEPEPQELISSDRRLEIALEVMYHELVSLPRMLEHIQHFWAAQPSQYHVRLIDGDSQKPIPMDLISNLITMRERLEWFRQFVQRLVADFKLDQLQDFLQRLEESNEH